MRKLLIIVLIFLGLIAMGAAWFVWGGVSNPANRTTIGEIRTPAGFERVATGEGSFGEFLRSFPLQKRGSKMKYADGSLAYFQYIGYAVLDLPLLSTSEQCCDAVQHMRSEYLFSKGRFLDIHFRSFQNGLMQYRGGNDKEALYKYLKRVFDSSNTSSLRHELKKKSWDKVAPGDVLVYEADNKHKNGHAVLIMDVAVNPKTGQKAILVAQSSMPALTMHVARNLRNPFKSPWIIVDETSDSVLASIFGFKKNDLRTW